MTRRRVRLPHDLWGGCGQPLIGLHCPRDRGQEGLLRVWHFVVKISTFLVCSDLLASIFRNSRTACWLLQINSVSISRIRR